MISTNLQLAAKALKSGGLIGLPTETVYGLAANIYDENAVRDVYSLKQRPLNHPLIVHIGTASDLHKVAQSVPQLAEDLAAAFWPGPLTLLLPKNAQVPDVVTSGLPTVAVRMPNHPLALALLKAIDFPLAAPSANPYGRISPSSAQHVQDYFGDDIEMVLDGGNCSLGIESTIVGFEDEQPIIYRLGSLSIEKITAITGPVKIFNKDEVSPRAPGMSAKHYAPRTPVVFSTDVRRDIDAFKHNRIGVILFKEYLADAPSSCQQHVLSPKGSLSEAGARLYAKLHQLDGLGLDYIVAEKFPEHDLGNSINDKLDRAALIKLL